MRKKSFVGTKDKKEREYEIIHREISRVAAEEGFTLLKNECNVLPIKKDTKIALYGSGASKTVKGGTGSGDVNSRHTVSIAEGLERAGYTITTKRWLDNFDKTYIKAREDWRDEIWRKVDSSKEKNLFMDYVSTPFILPCGDLPTKTDADTAIYVISRIAGEGADSYEAKGDYYLSDEESLILENITNLYDKVVVLLNVGSPIDLSFMDKYKNIYGLMLISQPGMEAGNAIANVISGDISPSGKLTDTWAKNYSDYPNSKTFSHNNKNVNEEIYEEGIYVGYRYFDTFSIQPRYGFGYGLTYTSFVSNLVDYRIDDICGNKKLVLKIKVTNTGDTYSAKEVVQAYVSCPQDEINCEYRRLVGWAKSQNLGPKDSEIVKIEIPLDTLASYSVEKSGWIIQKGIYGVFLGNSLESSKFVFPIQNNESFIIEKTKHICPLEKEITCITPPTDKIIERRRDEITDTNPIVINSCDFISKVDEYGKEYEKLDRDILSSLESLSLKKLIHLATGEMGQGDDKNNLGSAGIMVPGSAAQTSSIAQDEGIPPIVLADGPAGLRLNKEYIVKNNEIVIPPFEAALENGFLQRDRTTKIEGDTYYQYCTAIPCGTLIAQSWNTPLIEKVGAMIAEEMNIFNVTLWLAPGMNIHRNPLCGRNFEYYSEDPLLSGKIAAAMTIGVQSISGCGTTIKHFCLNNQEDNRMGSNSIVDERTLREIYLKGFEIAIKESQPFALMTSYNLVNGIHAANNFDLCTSVLRDEWNFKGLIMTDWITTQIGDDCTAPGCVKAGNDVVMPGAPMDIKALEKALEDGDITRKQLSMCIAHLVYIIRKSNNYKK